MSNCEVLYLTYGFQIGNHRSHLKIVIFYLSSCKSVRYFKIVCHKAKMCDPCRPLHILQHNFFADPQNSVILPCIKNNALNIFSVILSL